MVRFLWQDGQLRLLGPKVDYVAGFKGNPIQWATGIYDGRATIEARHGVTPTTDEFTAMIALELAKDDPRERWAREAVLIASDENQLQLFNPDKEPEPEEPEEIIWGSQNPHYKNSRWVYDSDTGELYWGAYHSEIVESNTWMYQAWQQNPARFVYGELTGERQIFVDPEWADQHEVRPSDQTLQDAVRAVRKSGVKVKIHSSIKVAKGPFNIEGYTCYIYYQGSDDNHDAWFFNFEENTLYYLYNGHHQELVERFTEKFSPLTLDQLHVGLRDGIFTAGDVKHGKVRNYDETGTGGIPDTLVGVLARIYQEGRDYNGYEHPKWPGEKVTARRSKVAGKEKAFAWNPQDGFRFGQWHTDIAGELISEEKNPADFIYGIIYPQSKTYNILSYDMGIVNKFDLKDQLADAMKKKKLRLAATVEDTEPEYNFGFLKEPHNELYPCAWEDMKMKPHSKHILKSHVLNALGSYTHADQWIVFTVFGSGASYNWDEDGDFDIQMWVDIDKFNEHHPDNPMSGDELIAEIRRNVQTVNFPSFKDLGLETKDCDGSMLVQYYPQLGTGSKEENLAKKPYACYDMETDEWFQRPEPITPEFYGRMFLAVHQKAEDIAVQAESLLAELDRNIAEWQFWAHLYSEYRNDEYRDVAERAQRNAIMEKEGIHNLFIGVFGGRQEAYSPEGEGYQDERDLTQKLLEVWGIFQKLKHFGREELPWDEQEMPDLPKTTYVGKKTSSDQVWGLHPDVESPPRYGAFGYLNGHLIIGDLHHQGIMLTLINNGWTWDDLMNAKQAWGWYDIDEDMLNVRFASDSGFINQDILKDAAEALHKLFPKYELNYYYHGRSVSEEDNYGQGLGRRTRDYLDRRLDDEEVMRDLREYIPGELPPPPSQKTSVTYDPNYWKEHKLAASGCFGFINGNLIIGGGHHQAIMAALISKGWTWEQLMDAEQAWGWFQVRRYDDDYYEGWHDEYNKYEDYAHINLQFTSDAGYQNEEAMIRAGGAFAQMYHLPVTRSEEEYGVEKTDDPEYGSGLSGRKHLDRYVEYLPAFIQQMEVPEPPKNG